MSEGPLTTRILLSGTASLAVGLVLTPLVILAARRTGLVAKPRADRWSRRPTALMGGIAIFAASAVSVWAVMPRAEWLLPAAAAASLIFLIGLLDDTLTLRPQYKLLAQVASACVLIAGGVQFGQGAGGWVLTVLFVAGITNAINLLDNMDGLAAGVSAIAAIVIAAGAFQTGNAPGAVGASAIAGAALAFLTFNFHRKGVHG